MHRIYWKLLIVFVLNSPRPHCRSPNHACPEIDKPLDINSTNLRGVVCAAVRPGQYRLRRCQAFSQQKPALSSANITYRSENEGSFQKSWVMAAECPSEWR